MTTLAAVPGPAVIALQDVSKRFTMYRRRAAGLKDRAIGYLTGHREHREDFWALRGVTLDVARGETLGVVGPNGCGKSTLLQIVAGILVPDRGRAVVEGRVTSLLELGAGFSPDLSGRENIFLNASLHGLSRAAIVPKFDEIVAFAELASFIDMPVRNYSSGMYMRLGMAVAVHLDPEIVLVDEAFAVGDEAFQRKCLRRLKAFQDQGITVVLVSHDLLLVERIAHRACLLDHGVVHAIGAPAAVIGEYHRLAAETGGVAGEYRWGNGDIRLTRVATRSGAGELCTVFRTGDAMQVTLEYEARTRVPSPVFGLAIYREDGAHLTGPNTRMNELPIPFVEGGGEVRYHIPLLPMLPGRYVLSASAYDRDLVTPYDHRERVGHFTVIEGGTLERFGLITLNGRWELIATGATERAGVS